MNFNNISIGCDIEKISRFENKIDDVQFLQKLYTENEIEYCKGKSAPARHLAARYCAKEAVIKALTAFKIRDVFYKDIEVRNEASGMPNVRIVKNGYNKVEIKISISHSDDTAFATVIAQNIHDN
ncbi:MAG: holo-ACP synthase [Rickettsiales bacterium]|nr:holo-ACP synthase [Rickettsiales bacterium]